MNNLNLNYVICNFSGDGIKSKHKRLLHKIIHIIRVYLIFEANFFRKIYNEFQSRKSTFLWFYVKVIIHSN